MPSTVSHTDYSILTMREDEFLAVVNRLDSYELLTGKGGRFYAVGELQTLYGSRRIAVARCDQGNLASAVATQEIMDDLSPRFVFLCGIADGVPSREFGLGDVVLATHILDFTLAAAHVGGTITHSSLGNRPEKIIESLLGILPAIRLTDWNSPEAIGVERPKEWGGPITFKSDDIEQQWLPNVEDVLKAMRGRQLPLRVSGQIGSSDTLIKDPGRLLPLLSANRHLGAVEMEATGVMRVLSQKYIPFLVVRGLSNVVGIKRLNAWTPYACATAASFLLALLKNADVDRLIHPPDTRVTTTNAYRKQANWNSQEQALHQKYLAQVIDTVGRLSLANINPQTSDVVGVPLEEIYVDLPTGYSLLAEVKDYKITNWWVSANSGENAHARHEMLSEPYALTENRTRPLPTEWQDEDAIRALVAQEQTEYDHRRAEAESAMAKLEYFYDGIEDGVQTVVPSLTIGQVADACSRLVALGAAGSGKSTFVRHLALCLAAEQQERRTRPASLSRLSGWTHGPLTPIYVELRRFVASVHFPTDLSVDHPWAEHLWRYIREEILGDGLAEYAPQLDTALREGHALLILDGLDEVPYPAGKGNLAKRQKQLRALAASLDDRYPTTRIVVASRPYAYESWQLEGYSAVRIAPFDDSKRIALASNLFRISEYPEPEQKAQRLNNALQQQGVSSELVDNPLFITLMATLFARSESGESLPSRKGGLYRESVLLLLERWTKAKPGMPTLSQLLGDTSRDELLARLAGLAYQVHAQYGAESNGVTPEIPSELLSNILFRMELDDPTVNARGLLTYLSENAGLLVSPGHRNDDHVFRFAHRTFQEYLAAVHIVEVCCKNHFVPVREHINLQPDLWRIPCLLVGDVLHDTRNHNIQGEQDAISRLWRLVDALLDGDAPTQHLTVSDPHWWPVWLAASIVVEHRLYELTQLSRGDLAIRSSLVQWLVKLLETGRALPPQERAHCGRVLGLLGDPRLGVGVRSDGLPGIAWGEPVLPGAYCVGGDEEAFQSLPAATVSLSHCYRLSKYLVTHHQFQCFVDADAFGYNSATYWTPAGWEWKAYRHAPTAGDGVFGLSNHPRVLVNWHEALAFCRWLTVRYHELGLLEIEEYICLPTEMEWEIGSRGSDGLLYPYGAEYDPSKGNTFETGIGQTSAVGLFPSGTSPYGILDMSGNVWEWCMTAFEDGSNDVEGDASRVLRGGSWYGSGGSARAAARTYGGPSSRDYNIGFRVVCLRR